MKNFWKDYLFLNSIDKSKKIILFGRSEDWIPKLLRKVNFKPYAICDSDESLDGTIFFNIKVIHKNKIYKKKDQDYFFVITSGEYRSIISELESKGYKSERDFICSPDFKDFAYLDNIRSMSGEILFSSSDYSIQQKATRYSSRGGGLFLLKFDETDIKIKKLIDGSFRQFCKYKDGIASISNDGNIYLLNNSGKIINKLNLKMSNLCGIDFIEKENLFILSSQTKDLIYLINSKNGKVINKIKFSSLSGEHKKSYHHINDLLYFEGYIYITFFSFSGSWKEGIYDGGIAKIDIKTKKVIMIQNNNFQPHSPAIIDGEIGYVDSGNQKVLLGPHKKELNFSGFVSGLREFKSYIFLGQSENMYISRLIKLGKLIDLTPGIFLIDYNTNSKRFLPALGVSNIHDIYPLKLSKKH